jgi:hypothetical protein
MKNSIKSKVAVKKTVEKPVKGKNAVKKTSSPPEKITSISVKAKMAPVKASFTPKTTSDSTAYFKNKAGAYKAAGEKHLASYDKLSATKGMGEFAKQSLKDATKNLKASAEYAKSAERQKMKGAVGKDVSGYATKIKPVTLKKK